MVRKSSDGSRAAGAAAGDQSEAGRADTREIDRDGPLSMKERRVRREKGERRSWHADAPETAALAATTI